MMFKAVDMDKYPRKAHFDYFNSMVYPYVGVTVNVDITSWMKKIREEGYPFFLSFLYEVVNSANSVTQFRQRIKDNGIIEFDKCSASFTVGLEDESYAYCAVDCDMPFDEYLSYAKKREESARLAPSIEEGEDAASHFFISCVPWLSYTAIVQPIPTLADSNPRITWGKYFYDGDRLMIPVTVLCHHALVDGIHIAKFYERLGERVR